MPSLFLFSQIGFNYLWISTDIGRQSLRNDLTEIKNQKMFTKRHDQTHLMLYQPYSELKFFSNPLYQFNKLINISGIHAGGRLIQQQKFRLQSKRPSYLNPALQTIGKVFRVFLNIIR